MTELIPSPQEKRDGVLRDHVVALLTNLDKRLGRTEARPIHREQLEYPATSETVSDANTDAA